MGENIRWAAVTTAGMLSIYGSATFMCLGLTHGGALELLDAITPGGGAMVGAGVWLVGIGWDAIIEGISEINKPKDGDNCK